MQGEEREREKDKTKLPNFISLMFPAGGTLYLDAGVTHHATPSLGVE